MRWRRALAVMASASGNTVPAIAALVSTSEDPVRETIHLFNDKGDGFAGPSVGARWGLRTLVHAGRIWRSSTGVPCAGGVEPSEGAVVARRLGRPKPSPYVHDQPLEPLNARGSRAREGKVEAFLCQALPERGEVFPRHACRQPTKP